MARPILLMKKDTLAPIYEKREIGVPLTKLIEQYHLNITHPTLARMIDNYAALDSAKNKCIKDLLEKALFPSWLVNQNNQVCKQPKDWYFAGIFPYGEWKERSNEK